MSSYDMSNIYPDLRYAALINVLTAEEHRRAWNRANRVDLILEAMDRPQLIGLIYELIRMVNTDTAPKETPK